MKKRSVVLAVVVFAAAGGAACAPESAASKATASTTTAPPALAPAPAPEIVNPRLLRRFQPFDAERGAVGGPIVALGKRLFFDPRMSAASDVSCNSCHDLGSFGVDRKRHSAGHRGHIGERNAPTVLNAAVSFAQFWDGRASTLEEQAKGPILDPREMAMVSPGAVVERLRAIPGYREPFRAAFPDASEPITFDNVARAIGAFERTLVTPGRWDRYLRGDKAALTEEEQKGLRTFLNVGCMVCHTGQLLGGSSFERVGALEPWPNQSDTGRMRVTRAEDDRMRFKVPSLRNVAETAPYFHDGSAETLEQAVTMMGWHQLGSELTREEVTSIVTWLRSLTSPLPAELVSPPTLP